MTDNTLRPSLLPTRRTHAGKCPVFATGSSPASDSQSSAAINTQSDQEGLR